MKSVQAICTVERLAIKMRFKVEQERTGFHFCMLYRCSAFCTPLDFFFNVFYTNVPGKCGHLFITETVAFHYFSRVR